MSSDLELLNITIKAGEAKPEDLKDAEKHGFNTQELADVVNKKTQRLKGKEVSVRIYLYPKAREYYIEVVPPETTELILWKAGAKAPSGDPAHNKVGNVTLEDMIHIAIAKKSELLTRDLKKAVKMLLGSARSLGVTVENKDPKEVTKEVEEGVYEDLFQKYLQEWEEV